MTLRHSGDYRDHIGEENEALSCIPTLSKLLALGFIGPYIGPRRGSSASPVYSSCSTTMRQHRPVRPGGGMEEMGHRIVEIPEDPLLTTDRDPHSGFIAYFRWTASPTERRWLRMAAAAAMKKAVANLTGDDIICDLGVCGIAAAEVDGVRVLYSVNSSPEPDNNTASDATEPNYSLTVIIFWNVRRRMDILHPITSPSPASSVAASSLLW